MSEAALTILFLEFLLGSGEVFLRTVWDGVRPLHMHLAQNRGKAKKSLTG